MLVEMKSKGRTYVPLLVWLMGLIYSGSGFCVGQSYTQWYADRQVLFGGKGKGHDVATDVDPCHRSIWADMRWTAGQAGKVIDIGTYVRLLLSFASHHWRECCCFASASRTTRACTHTHIHADMANSIHRKRNNTVLPRSYLYLYSIWSKGAWHAGARDPNQFTAILSIKPTYAWSTLIYNFSCASYKRIVETIQHKIDLLTDETRVQWHLLLGGSMQMQGKPVVGVQCLCGAASPPYTYYMPGPGLCVRASQLHASSLQTLMRACFRPPFLQQEKKRRQHAIDRMID